MANDENRYLPVVSLPEGVRIVLDDGDAKNPIPVVEPTVVKPTVIGETSKGWAFTPGFAKDFFERYPGGEES